MNSVSIKKTANGAEYLKSVQIGSDCLDVDQRGILTIGGVAADRLVAEFGSPLFVISESTVRQNFRAVRRAFSERWPAPVNVMYAIKANNNLAVRAIVSAEGGGGDCFGMGELYATFQGGADPALIAMNGSLKTAQEIDEAVRRGVTINIDAEDEIDKVCAAARKYGVRAKVMLRLKILNDYLRNVGSDYMGISDEAGIYDRIEAIKFGFGPDMAAALTRRLADLPELDHVGFHYHVGRYSLRKDVITELYSGFAQAVVRLHEQTGFWPRIVDIGGGIPRERDPESRQLALNQLKIDDYAETVCGALLSNLKTTGLPTPALWLEPGRYIIGNASVLLTTIGTIKRDLGRIWVNVDSSTNLLMRIDTSASRYHILPATGMTRSFKEPALIVGLTCIPSVFSANQSIPDLAAGDVLAILDTGMYSETTSTQFNGVPRPATVLVNDGDAELIKARETVEDVFRLHQIPERLRGE
ncbi:alanine racemase [Microvirga sp. VF16]|uniref:diaminopimelate decarboxylase family protein n=1 Tax=Microvirga sp. VF16 TaxID=2807101 RepID=UPI00193D8448|nr:alanine racemase [Microvirga sp. VF16]QRM32893.1 alanine racemase [Microvirga sp. VF16]